VQAGFGVHAVRQGECASVSVRGEVIRAWVARLQQACVQCLLRNAFFREFRLTAPTRNWYSVRWQPIF
jgi:hypothetical protein